MNTIRIKQIFQSKFDYQTYCNEIVHSIFGCNDVAVRPELLDTTAEGDECNYIGRMTDTNGRELGFFYTRVASGSDVRRKRIGLRKMIAPYLKYDVDAAIAVFADENRWRLSYICDLKEGVTNAKRFSYILGDEQGQYKTPLERLETISTKRGRYVLNDLCEAFSVDALSDEFFDEYHVHYDRIVAELARQGKSGAVYHDYVKKLMGRIVFLHFLQKKGWLCGDTNFMLNTFSQSNRRNDYLESVLEPLFFGILNTEPAKREQVFSRNGWQQRWVGQWAEIPYLNGGLFERDDVDDLRIVLPESIFSNLFNFLASYNFTVDENDPDDAEIGVDPEMLGKIFESLLEDNKAKGAFYTPKEIVRYMCKESLIAYLASKLPDVNGSVVRTFVEHHEMQPELEPYRASLSQALRDVKICDPAIGSGAFPMGLLNELWRCREALEPTESRVALKKEIIENNIYGVDIERGAIDIARLRFWLSIVVDSEQAEPLPNFDYKFMQGNSLIESYQGCDLSRISGRTVGRPSTSNQLIIGLDSDLSRKNLQRLLRDYFSVTDHQQKANMRQAINDEVKTLIRESLGGTTATLAKLEKLDPSANQDFFLWHTWFKDIFDNGGFDIVIGNPPYIRQELLGMDYKDILIGTYPEVGNGIADICVYFFGLGIKILRVNGILSFITSNKFLKTKYGKELRHTLTNKVTVDRIIDFFELPVFNASTDAGITILSKSLMNIPTRYYPIKTLDNLNLTEVTLGVYLTTIKSDSGWQFIEDSNSSLLDKINFDTISLKVFTGDRIYRGITTGLNKAFVVKDNTLAQRLLNSESAPLIKKYAQSTDIKMWEVKNDNKYFIATGFETNVEQYYPTVFQYLKQYKDELENRCDKGTRYYNLRACAYYEEFEKPKLIYIHTAKDHQFYFDTKGHYINNSCYMIVTNSKFLFFFLNSRLFKYYKKLKFVAYGDGQEAGRCKLDYNKMITVPIKKGVDEKPFSELYEKIIEIKKTNSTIDTSALEYLAEKYIYSLYNLTPEEIAVIEG